MPYRMIIEAQNGNPVASGWYTIRNFQKKVVGAFYVVRLTKCQVVGYECRINGVTRTFTASHKRERHAWFHHQHSTKLGVLATLGQGEMGLLDSVKEKVLPKQPRAAFYPVEVSI